MEVDVESKGRVVFNFGLLLFGFKAAHGTYAGTTEAQLFAKSIHSQDES